MTQSDQSDSSVVAKVDGAEPGSSTSMFRINHSQTPSYLPLRVIEKVSATAIVYFSGRIL